MQRYLLERSVQLVLVLFFLSIIVFTIVRLIPGDPAAVMLGTEATPQVMAQIRREMGLDQPIPVQYVRWLRAVLAGNFGTSWVSKQPALALILGALPVTLQLVASAFVVALAIALPGGHRRRAPAALVGRPWVDDLRPSRGLAAELLAGHHARPAVLARAPVAAPRPGTCRSGPIPSAGSGRASCRPSPSGVALAAPLTRFLRSGMLDVLALDYVRTARAKGMSERAVVTRHALKNALLSVVTVLGLQLGALLGGSIVIEQVFGWPGLGRLSLAAIQQRDYGVVQGVVLFVATAFVLVNFAVDLLYLYLDPRIRYGRSS